MSDKEEAVKFVGYDSRVHTVQRRNILFPSTL